ncbi:hypothetical protein D3C87_1540340 [compost metagenome]
MARGEAQACGPQQPGTEKTTEEQRRTQCTAATGPSDQRAAHGGEPENRTGRRHGEKDPTEEFLAMGVVANLGSLGQKSFMVYRRINHLRREVHQQRRTADPQDPAHGFVLQQNSHAGQRQHGVDQVADAGAQAQRKALKIAALHRQGDHRDVGHADVQAQRKAQQKATGKFHRTLSFGQICLL